LRPQALLIPQLSSFEFHPSTADWAAFIPSLGGAPFFPTSLRARASLRDASLAAAGAADSTTQFL
jgi:hypothetical protein